MRRIIFVLGLALVAPPAFADVQDYCAAVARDFADLRPQDQDIWQKRYDDASADCVEQFSAPPLTAEVQPKPKKKLVAVKPSNPEPAKPTKASQSTPKKTSKKPATEVATAENATAEPVAKVAETKQQLTPGTAEWLDYCTRKYSSFNREKGTYVSKTGVERKCLVTADFR